MNHDPNAQPDSDSEAEAVRRTLAGDPSAFEPLVRAHIEVVRAVCRKHTGDASEAEDATQEVFLRAYRSLESFHTEGSFGAWIRGIALNQVRTRYARFARRRDNETPYEFDSADGRQTPEEAASEESTREEIRAAVGTLKPSVREIMQRYYFDEQSVDEIAQELGLQRENVKSRLHRGRKALRKILVDNATGA
ncbi:MAG: RNA polymerase sigma factor [bacterium]